MACVHEHHAIERAMHDGTDRHQIAVSTAAHHPRADRPAFLYHPVPLYAARCHQDKSDELPLIFAQQSAEQRRISERSDKCGRL
jgi:hypothetical protein